MRSPSERTRWVPWRFRTRVHWLITRVSLIIFSCHQSFLLITIAFTELFDGYTEYLYTGLPALERVDLVGRHTWLEVGEMANVQATLGNDPNPMFGYLLRPVQAPKAVTVTLLTLSDPSTSGNTNPYREVMRADGVTVGQELVIYKGAEEAGFMRTDELLSSEGFWPGTLEWVADQDVWGPIDEEYAEIKWDIKHARLLRADGDFKLGLERLQEAYLARLAGIWNA